MCTRCRRQQTQTMNCILHERTSEREQHELMSSRQCQSQVLGQPSALARTDKSVPEDVTMPLPCGDLDYEVESSHDGLLSPHGRGALITRKPFSRETHVWVDNRRKVVGARRVFRRRRWENARLNQIRKEREGLNAVASVPALRPSDPTWLLPELGTGRITHVEVLLRCAFAVHASKLARPRNWYWYCSSGFSTCTPGTSGRSRTSLSHDCRSTPHTPCSER